MRFLLLSREAVCINKCSSAKVQVEVEEYYLRTESNNRCVACRPRLALELGSCVDGEAGVGTMG